MPVIEVDQNGEVTVEVLAQDTMVSPATIEQIQDAVGPMFNGIEDGLTATYNDGGNVVDFVNTDKGSVAIASLVAGAGLTRTGNTFDAVSANSNHIVVNADSIDTGLQVPLTNSANVFTAFNTFQTLGSPDPTNPANIATFWSGFYPAAGNLFGINVNKIGYEAVYLGINRDTAYSEVPGNAVFLSTFHPDGQISIGRGGNSGDIYYSDILVTSTGMVTMRRGVRLAVSALATDATDGFTYIPTCVGTPTGTPTAQTGTVPLVYDTSANRLYIYSGGWKSVTLS